MTSEADTTFWGHSRNGGGNGVAEPLSDHVRRVEDLAAGFGTELGLAGEAAAAARLHDLGKYSDRFQRYVRGGGGRGGDHAAAGACLAARLAASDGDRWLSVAEAVASHHGRLTRLQDMEDGQGSYRSKATSVDASDPDIGLLERRFVADGLTTPDAGRFGPPPPDADAEPAAAMLDARMLFSCLVDADWLATEGHFAGDAATPYRPRPAGPTLDFAAAADAVDRYVNAFPHDEGPMADARRVLREDCLRAAESPPGTFTLAAPTGSGKTLSMLAFALRHADMHGMRRIVFVAPFLSIAEQTAGVIRNALAGCPGFSRECVLEDHGLADAAEWDAGDDQSADARRLLAENWDAPIVVTSSVKGLESLHAARTSACRKLHRLGRSVLLFDEVQTIPPELAVLTLATLSALCDRFGSSVVFATATQPAFESLDPDEPPEEDEFADPPPTVSEWASAGWRPREIVADPPALFAKAAGRVRVRWNVEESKPLSEIAADLCGADGSALAIVNLKRHAAELFEAVRDADPSTPVRHLSTSMCPAHRQAVLADVRDRLPEEPVRLISTQCVEAGVDVSFASGWRAMAPLDSIAQAAGRVNRSGEFEGPRPLTVFRVEGDGQPPGYAAGVGTLNSLLGSLRSEGIDLNETDLLTDPALIRRYFKRLYSLTGGAVPPTDLAAAVEGCDFTAVEALYRLIDADQVNVLVPYDRPAFELLIDRFESSDRPPGWAGRWMADARPHTVGLFVPQLSQLVASGVVAPLPFGDERRDEDSARWWRLLDSAADLYDAAVGLRMPREIDVLLA